MIFTWGFSGREATLQDLQSQVGPGWSKLIEDLCTDLFKLGWDGVVFQVKEKYGTLRFYAGSGTAAIFNRINDAEQASSVTCEVCGQPGKRRGRMWLYTACTEHTREGDVKKLWWQHHIV